MLNGGKKSNSGAGGGDLRRENEETDPENHTALLFNGTPPFNAVLNHTPKKKPREISADKPVKRTRIIHYCQHNHSMKREGEEKGSRTKNEGLKPLDTAKHSDVWD